jgi:hypothetical protein
MSIKASVTLALLLAIAACVTFENQADISPASQYVPIPKRYPGLFIGSANAAINIELVYDPTCNQSSTQATAVRSLTTLFGT